MSPGQKKRQGGTWLLGLLSLIAAAIGIRYANSAGLLPTIFDQDSQAFQTVSTGVSVQAPAPGNDSTQNGQSDQTQSFRGSSGNPTTDSSSPNSSSDSYNNDSVNRDREGRRARW
ncbi:MAG: hypothetical protein HC866_23535 [Leptolyngbyaceae cyanobacterium RU_5_1]|nr:hypothetical protein [Leptolyngbyaceae cyanobacterium RU_5_1]